MQRLRLPIPRNRLPYGLHANPWTDGREGARSSGRASTSPLPRHNGTVQAPPVPGTRSESRLQRVLQHGAIAPP